MNEEHLCSICQEGYSESKAPFKLSNCDHIFHIDCVKRWQQECIARDRMPQCPFCRREFDENRFQLVKRLLPKLINLFVKNLENRTLTIQIESNATVQQFAEIVQIRSGIPKHEMRFTANGKSFCIQNHAADSLEKFGIQNGSTIFQLLRLRGGINYVV